jgi:hypothetical protein
MVSQIRALFDRYVADGGRYREEVSPTAGTPRTLRSQMSFGES